MKLTIQQTVRCAATSLAAALLSVSVSAFAADRIEGRVEGGGQPVAKADVTLWAAGPGDPQKLAGTQTGDDGSFDLPSTGERDSDGVLYLIAKGPNPAIALMTILGTAPPQRVTINELTTIASAWTSAQFLHGAALKGDPLALRIAAGNVPNLVDLETGGLGPVIQDPLNSSQTTTLAKLNTLGNLLSACLKAMPGACEKLFEAATPPGGKTPSDTLSAAQNIARYPWHKAQRLFALFDELYPVSAGKRWRDVPHIPYLNFAPSAWTLSLVYAGGGLNSLGGIAIDGEGNLWADDNFLVGAQSTIYAGFGGGLSKLAPNGEPLSPMTTGFRGGGIDGPGFGIAISADDKVWATSLAGKNISVFDRKTGRPLSPETGYDFDGKLGTMQGIIVTPNGDVWALDNGNDQIVYLPGGDASKGRILGRTLDGKPVDGTLQVKAPFHLAIDQQDRIWVTNSGSDTVTRFPTNDPGNAKEFKVGIAPRAVAIDSHGNAWVANTVGHPDTAEKLALIKAKLESKVESLSGTMSKAEAEVKEWIDLFEILKEYPGGDVSMIRPDGTVLPPFDGNESLVGPWGVAIDGNDNVWIANSTGRSVTQLCGVRTETCPPRRNTGDPISPSTGYVGGLQIITDVAVDPAGNVWVANNWDLPERVGFEKAPEEAISTRFGGDGAVVFFGLAKPVRTPLIGPVQAK
jgi:streptogramin lyase